MTGLRTASGHAPVAHAVTGEALPHGSRAPSTLADLGLDWAAS
ncbi:hypothetical protein [Streptomyces afghaniensis]